MDSEDDRLRVWPNIMNIADEDNRTPHPVLRISASRWQDEGWTKENAYVELVRFEEIPNNRDKMIWRGALDNQSVTVLKKAICQNIMAKAGVRLEDLAEAENGAGN